MQELRQLGPYQLLSDLAAHAGVRWAIGQSADSNGPVVLMFPVPNVADEGGYRLRYRTEASNSRRLTGPWVADVVDVAPASAEQPWVAYDCFPALPLSSVLDALGGPLPEDEVLSLAAVLALALLAVHRQGLVFAGLTPDSLLLTESGPRLTGYGLIRSAASEGVATETIPGVLGSTLAPSYRSGARPQQADDMYALGIVLASASTGHTDHPAELSGALGRLAGDCLMRDPERRPRADVLAERFRAAGVQPSQNLPEVARSALGRQVLSCRTQTDAMPVQPPPQEDGEQNAETVVSAVFRQGQLTSRRALCVSAAVGVAGLAVGAGSVSGWRAWGPNSANRLPAEISRGAPPKPLWRHDMTPLGEDWSRQRTLLDSRRILLGGENLAVLEVRTGKKVWARGDLYSEGGAFGFPEGVLIPGSMDFKLAAIQSGKVKWSDERYGEGSKSFEAGLTAGGGVFYFSTRDLETRKSQLVALRVSDRKEIWRRPIPAEFAGDPYRSERDGVAAEVYKNMLLVPNIGTEGSPKKHSYIALDVQTGKQLWQQEYPSVEYDPKVIQLLPGGRFVVGLKNSMRCFSLRHGNELWRVDLERKPESCALTGNTLYVSLARRGVHAVDVRTGSTRWSHQDFMAAESGSLGEVHLSSSGDTLLRTLGPEVGAMRTRDGRPLWRMTVTTTQDDLESQEPGAVQVLATTTGVALLASQEALYGMPVD